jgi:hypothetical protein
MHIESKLRWVRDVTYQEEQVPGQNRERAPCVMAQVGRETAARRGAYIAGGDLTIVNQYGARAWTPISG